MEISQKNCLEAHRKSFWKNLRRINPQKEESLEGSSRAIPEGTPSGITLEKISERTLGRISDGTPMGILEMINSKRSSFRDRKIISFFGNPRFPPGFSSEFLLEFPPGFFQVFLQNVSRGFCCKILPGVSSSIPLGVPSLLMLKVPSGILLFKDLLCDSVDSFKSSLMFICFGVTDSSQDSFLVGWSRSIRSFSWNFS